MDVPLRLQPVREKKCVATSSLNNNESQSNMSKSKLTPELLEERPYDFTLTIYEYDKMGVIFKNGILGFG